MKRVIIAFVMLSAAVTVAAVSSVMLDRNIKSIISDVENLLVNINGYEQKEIQDKTEDISEKWLKTSKILKLVSFQDKISPISEKFRGLSYSDTNDLNELSRDLTEIKVMLEVFLSSEEVVWANIL